MSSSSSTMELPVGPAGPKPPPPLPKKKMKTTLIDATKMSVSHRWPFRNESSNSDLGDPIKDRDGQTREESWEGGSLRDSSDSSQVERQRIAQSPRLFIGIRLCLTQIFPSLFCDWVGARSHSVKSEVANQVLPALIESRLAVTFPKPRRRQTFWIFRYLGVF